MGMKISLETNASKSFATFISGVQRVAAEMGYLTPQIPS